MQKKLKLRRIKYAMITDQPKEVIVLKKMFNIDRMRTWKQGVSFLTWQENQKFRVFISDVGIRGLYFSLTLGIAKFKSLDFIMFFTNAGVYIFLKIWPNNRLGEKND